MPSPFPGMDPYLEPHWLDVHTSLVAGARRALNKELPSGLVARVEERVSVESESEVDRKLGPDVRVFEPAPASGRAAVAQIDAPFVLEATDDPIIERFVRIVDHDGKLITVIEFLSPTNKRQPGRHQFRVNRRQLIASGVNFVEIDLVRAGNWRRLMSPNVCPPAAVAAYRIIVYVPRRHEDDTLNGYLFPAPIDTPLPDVPVPLRSDDPVVQLHLQPLLNEVYDEGRYAVTLRYDRPPAVDLDFSDAAWVDRFLASRR